MIIQPACILALFENQSSFEKQLWSVTSSDENSQEEMIEMKIQTSEWK